MPDSADATVLLVEDEPAVLDSFEMMLEDSYEVLTAAEGDEALEKVDDADVVLLDRMMPGMSGDEVLAEIRDRNAECRVVMVSAVDPDFDIIEMGFDDYVTKPPTEEELTETVAEVLERSEFTEGVREYRSLLAKRSVLEQEKHEPELEDSDTFQNLEERIEDRREELDEENERLLDDAEFVGALRELGPDSSEEGENDEQQRRRQSRARRLRAAGSARGCSNQ